MDFQSPCSSTFRWRLGVISEIEQKSDFQYFGQRIFERRKPLNSIAEQLLNNQPLTVVSSDIEDLDKITPNHFLVGGANVSWPISLFSDNNASYRKMFRHISEQLKALWKQ